MIIYCFSIKGYIVWLVHRNGFETLYQERPMLTPNLKPPSIGTANAAAQIARTASMMLSRVEFDLQLEKVDHNIFIRFVFYHHELYSDLFSIWILRTQFQLSRQPPTSSTK